MKLVQVHEKAKSAHDLIVERRDRVMNFFVHGSHSQKAKIGAGLVASGSLGDLLIAIQRQPNAGHSGGSVAVLKIVAFDDLLIAGIYGTYLFAVHFKHTQAYEKLADRVRIGFSRMRARELAEAGAVRLPEKKADKED